jgi:hypothetical protein
MWRRAERQDSSGASALFARLDVGDARLAEAVIILERLVNRLRAGDWNEDLADLVAHATVLDQTLTGGAPVGSGVRTTLAPDPAGR